MLSTRFLAITSAVAMFLCGPARAGLDDYALGNGQHGTTFSVMGNNDYRLLNANAAAGATTITLDSNTGVVANQLVLIIQMRVASNGPGNTTTPLDLNANGIGQFEYARLVSFASGTTWNLDKALVRSYTSSAADQRVQVVRLREYTNVTVPNTNVIPFGTPGANRGGIFALMAQGNVTMTGTNAIDASTDGFFGGALSGDDQSLGCTLLDSNLTGDYGQKGQGPWTFAATIRGRGNRGTGGGGGVCRNSGGGGGGNGSAGGKGGGSAINNDGGRDVGGFGGTATSGNLLMNMTFGGGGGGGQQNETAGSAGARGGGIIIIRANSILGTGSFRANGGNGANTNSDGAGGGGGGGTIILRAAATLQCSAISANGGNGGNVAVTGGGTGGGGGGGGGRVLLQATTGPSCTATVTPGLAGVGNSAGALHFATGSQSVPPTSPGVVQNPNPGLNFLYARLGRVDVIPSAGGTTVRFSTVTEVGSAGFFVERTGPGGGYRLEPGFLRTAPLGFGGATYSAIDRARTPGSYRIVEIDRDGRASSLGTFAPSQDPMIAAPPPVQPAAPLVMTMAPAPALPAYLPGAHVPALDRVKLVAGATTAASMWRVPVAELAPHLGLSTDQALSFANTGALRATQGGVDARYAVDGFDLVVLVRGEAQPKQRPYAAVFFSVGTGARADLVVGDSVESASLLPQRHRLDADLIPALAGRTDGDADFWMGAYVSAESPDTASASFIVNAEQSGADATVDIETDPAFGPWSALGQLDIEWNGVSIGTFSVPMVRSTLHAVVPAAAILDGENTLTLVALTAPEGPTGLFINTVAVTTYARATLGTQGVARVFDASGGPVGGSAFVSGSAAAFAVFTEGADDSPFIALAGGAAQLDGNTTGTVLLAEPATDVTILSAAAAPSLPFDTRSVIFTHHGLRDAAAALAALHDAEGHTAAVVVVDDLYDTYSDGHIDARAMTAFLRAERDRGVLVRFVTLLGRGDFAPSSWLEPALPPRLIGTSEGIFSSDRDIADLDGDGVAELAVGRIPVQDAGELTRYLARRALHQALGDIADAAALFVSDRSTGDYQFNADLDRARTGWPHPDDVLLSLDTVDAATARGAFFTAVASGTRLVDFVGHGGMDRLGSDGLVTSADAAGFAGTPTVILAPTCVAARTELGFLRVIGERLLVDGDAGPVAVVSASGLVHHAEAAALNAELWRLLRERRAGTLGELVMNALRTAGRAADVTVLLGDPTLRVTSLVTPAAEFTDDPQLDVPPPETEEPPPDPVEPEEPALTRPVTELPVTEFEGAPLLGAHDPGCAASPGADRAALSVALLVVLAALRRRRAQGAGSATST